MFKHFQSTSVVGWLLVAAISGTLFWLRPSTPQTLRPIVSEELSPGLANVSAKLWQDPLEVGYASLRAWKENRRDELSKIHAETSGRLAGELKAPKEGNSVGLFIITLPGGGGAEKKERRLRLRYATQAAMDHLGFRSSDAEVLGVVPLPSRIEFPEGLWNLKRGDLAAVPLQARMRLQETNVASKVNFDRVLVWEKWTRRPKASEVGSPRGESTSTTGSEGRAVQQFDSIVVVWLDESIWAGSSPMKEIDWIKNRILGSQASEPKAIIFGSGTESLLRLLEENLSVSRPAKDTPESALESSPKIYFPYSTVPAVAIYKHLQKEILNAQSESSFSWENVQIAKRIWRPLISDDRLIAALMKELSIRGISPGDHVVLITESDSLYGEEMANEFWRQWDRGGSFAQEFRYLRGVDGNLPSITQVSAKQASPANPMTQLFQSWLQAKEPRLLLDRRQVDYLERIGRHISKAGETKGSGPLRMPPKAIGIFGADVFDKHQILQVLRPQFPGTLFFTTDLDTLWIQNSDPLISRNLVVASAAGLTHVGADIGKFGPFRDSYQTALYGCLISAVRGASSKGRPDFSRPDALVYEIGRTKIHPMKWSGLSSDFEERSLAEEPIDLDFAPRHQQKSISHYLKSPEVRWAATVFCVLVIAALALILRSANLSQLSLDWSKFGIWGGLTALGLLLFLWILRTFGDAVWGEEAFHWIEGISIWPSVGIRLIATLLGITFVTVMWSDTSWDKSASLETKFLEDVRSRISWLFGSQFALLSIALAVAILSLVTLIPHLLDIRPAFFTPARGLAAMNAADVSLLLSLAAFYLAFASSGLMHFRLAYYITHFLSEFEKHDWKVGDGQAVGLAKVVAERAKAAGNSILYPFALLAFLMIARSTIFDNWNFPTFLMVFVGVVSVLLIACGLALSAALREFRTLLEGSLPQTTPKEQLAALSPFLGSSWIESPALKAVAIAVGGIGIANLEQIFLSMK